MKTKTCIKCNQEKSVDNFGNDKSRKDGKDTYCKSCKSEQQKRFKRKYPSRHKYIALKHRFGLTPEQYDKMLKKQRGVCAICGNINRNGAWLSVDHDHITDEIRGLLCSNCNHAIGCMHDSPVVLRNAAKYLEGE